MTARSRFARKVLGWSVLASALATVPVAAQTVKTDRLTDTEVVALIEKAKTPADHERLAAYYEQIASDLDQKAKQHKEFAAAYRRNPGSGNPARTSSTMAEATHCDRIASALTKTAKEARTMEDHHKMLAKEAAAH